MDELTKLLIRPNKMLEAFRKYVQEPESSNAGTDAIALGDEPLHLISVDDLQTLGNVTVLLPSKLDSQGLRI